jgi:hypothetical protein
MIRGVPYDHQLEYIESTGSQYIDTGFTATDTMSYKGKIMLTGLAYNSGMFGYRFVNSATAYGNMRFSFVYSDGRIGLRNGLEIQNSTNKMVVGSIYQIEVDNQYFKVNGDIWISANNRKAAMTPPGKAWLFFVNCTGYYNTDVQHPITMRMYSWQIFDNGAIVRDFIPVSVNGVAMMYDRVTGTFPKHYGTFVAGPVASTPLMGVHLYPKVYTAADYVQDGLVAIWDGIENAGWGQHDESPHLPVNLVDGQPLSINGDVEIGSNYFKFGAGKWGYSTIPDFASAVASKSFTVEIVAKNDKVSNAGIISIGSRGVWLYADSSNNIRTLNILSSTYTPSPDIRFKSSDIWRATIQGGATPQIIINDRTMSAQYGTQTSVSSSVFYIGSLQGTPNWSNGTMWCSSVRLYSRNLTASEKAANDAIDNARFFCLGGQPGSFGKMGAEKMLYSPSVTGN